MPISKIKGSAINDGAITLAKTDSLFVNTEISGTEGARMPVGTTAQRANAQVGDLRHNSTLGILEQYTADGWQGIAASPAVNSVSPNNIDESDDPQTLVITGSAFDSGATALLVGSGGNITPTTSTRNSSSQITIVYSGSDVITTDTGPFDVKVTNSTGLAGTLDDAVTFDDAPNWSTSAGSLGTVFEDVAMSTLTVAATDPEGASVTYSVTSGALPTGTSLGSSNGQITGTPNVSDTYNSSGVTHNFTVTANDGTGNTTPRAFSILRKWYDGSTDALAMSSPESARALGLSDGIYKFKFSSYNSGNAFPARYGTYNNRGWIEVLQSSSSNNGRPWLGWLGTSSAGYTGSLSSSYYYLKNYQNLSGGGLDYSQGGSIILLGNSNTWTDVAFTTKSSRTANGVAASGQNQSSSYPMIAGAGGGKNLAGSDAATVKTQLALYFSGQRDGFHAAVSRSDTGARDYTAYWPTTGSSGFDVILAKRTGSGSSDEWHVAEGVDDASSTYAPNYGYRGGSTDVAYHTANVGAFNSSTDGKDTYAISTSNVMSIWLTDA